MKKSILAIVLAVNFIEWLEFSLYLYMAKAVFSTMFFPKSTHSLALTFLIFSTAYLARPVGGWFFGKNADRFGRKKPMMLTAGLMGFATLGICLLPGYEQIGLTATFLLLLFRILQGLALGGEVNTSAMYIIEHHASSPMLAGSLVAAFGALGMFFGAVLSAIIQMSPIDGLWRIVFALIGIISLLVCHMRKNLSESPEFLTQKTISLKTFKIDHFQNLINIAAVALFVSVSVYICNVFWMVFSSQLNMMSTITSSWVAAFAQFGSALIAIPVAYIFSSTNPKKLLQLSMSNIIICAPALFWATYHHSIVGIALGLMGYMITNGLLCASFYYYLYQQLPTSVRCQGVSFIWACAASVGALALPVAQEMVFKHQIMWVPGFMVSGVVLLCLLVISKNNPADYRLKSISLH